MTVPLRAHKFTYDAMDDCLCYGSDFCRDPGTKEAPFKTIRKAEDIEKYEYFHSKEGVWPEVIHAARSSGIQKIIIYRFGNRRVMIITIPRDLDKDEMNRIYASSTNRMPEWDTLMKDYMQGLPGAAEGATWVPLKLIHDDENGFVK